MKQKNQMNIQEISNLEKEIECLKKVVELQSLVVGRKLIKIFLKIILNYCFEDYNLKNKDEIIVKKI